MKSHINNNPMAMMNEFVQRLNQFKSTFKGDPKQKIQEMLNSGQLSQDQFNQFQTMAKQVMQFMPK